MPYTIGETYIWTDDTGAVHVWGKKDAKLDLAPWRVTYNQQGDVSGVVISAAIWRVLKDCIIREACGDTARRILIGDNSEGMEETA